MIPLVCLCFFRYLKNRKATSACALGLSEAKILQISDNSGRPIIASGLSFLVSPINSNAHRHCWFHLLFHYKQWQRGAPSQWPWVRQHNCFDWFCLTLGLTKWYKFPAYTSFPVSTLTPLPPPQRELLPSPSGDVHRAFVFFSSLSVLIKRNCIWELSPVLAHSPLCFLICEHFSLRSDSKRHCSAEERGRYSISLCCSCSVMVGHLPQGEVPPNQLSAVRSHLICIPSQDNCTSITYLPPLQCYFVS